MNKRQRTDEFSIADEPVRMSLVVRSAQLLRKLWNRYLLTGLEDRLRQLYRNREPAAPLNSSVVTIQCVENLFYLCLFGEIIRSLRQRQTLRVEQIVIRSLVPLDRNSEQMPWFRKLLRKFIRRLHTNGLSDQKLIRLFGAYADGIAYRAAMRLSFWQERKIRREANTLWRSVKTKDELVAMRAHGIDIGDLVADSYLRFRPSPVLRLDDPYMRTIIEQALRDIFKAFAYFRRVRPALFLTSYTSYVQHGVPARVAAQLGIRVQSFGSYQDFSKLITPEDTCHQRVFARYARDFDKLKSREDKIRAAGAHLGARVRGSIDDAIGYMKSSHYANGEIDIPDVKGAVVIFLHDFYDSLHAYHWMVFHDFWEWACFTIEALREKNIPFFIKPHPNQTAASAADFREMKRIYPDLGILPPHVSNRQLVEGGMSCAVTVYGSVACEMGYMGVPAINCADNPHISFNFSLTARSKEEYKNLLQSHAILPRDKERMRREAAAFYYMHTMNLPPSEIALRDKFVRMNLLALDANEQHSWDADELIRGFDSIGADEGFSAFIDDISRTVADPHNWAGNPSGKHPIP